MIIDFAKYKVETLLIAAILVVMFGPYVIISTSVFGTVTSETKLKEIETVTQQLTPIFIGLLCGLLVYRSFKRNKENK